MPSTDLEVAPTTTNAKTFKTAGYAAKSATTPLAPFSLERREPGPRDVQIEILYCGVCHSDLHTARNEWDEHHLSRRARTRNCRPRQQGRRRR